jgi:REP element-mobilizing transposase RayT
MPRRPRSDLPDGIYHVTARGTGGIFVFIDNSDRARFAHLLSQVVEMFSLRLHAWCLLGTHFHVVAECPREQLSSALHRLNGLYAQQFNERHDRRGHLFEERFASRLIETEEHLHAAIRYVLENPVAAGLCREPQEWLWSWPRDRFGWIQRV